MIYNKLYTVADQIAICSFSLISFLKGYRFLLVGSMREESDFEKVNQGAGVPYTPEIASKLRIYKNGGVRFIAYHGKKPVGTVRLGDPNIINRPFEVFHVNEDCLHYEIQNLSVVKEYREGSQFIMLGLFKAMYCYSRYNRIESWMGFSTYGVFRTMRRYNKDIRRVDIDAGVTANPIARFLCRRGIVEICYTMSVDSFSPSCIFMQFLKYKLKGLTGWFSFLKWQTQHHESINYGSK